MAIVNLLRMPCTCIMNMVLQFLDITARTSGSRFVVFRILLRQMQVPRQRTDRLAVQSL